MTHRFPIKEIARQAGLGTATVDRVLNNRPHVGPQSRKRVLAAIRELEAQEAQLIRRGRQVMLDIVAEAPQRFTREIRAAAEAAQGSVPGAAIRLRFQFAETMTEDDVVVALARIARRGSDGVCLKARDTPGVRAAVDRLAAGGVAVFTLVTDLPGTARRGYFGLDNAQAGRTAAFLLAQALPRTGATVLTSRSQDGFRGETERYAAFRRLLADLQPTARVIDVAGGAGVANLTARHLCDAVPGATRIDAVYSMGGGNAGILRALAEYGQQGAFFVAHDLDRDNRRLLVDGAIHIVLHHDLETDLRRLFRAALNGADPAQGSASFSDVQIITPHNLPQHGSMHRSGDARASPGSTHPDQARP